MTTNRLLEICGDEIRYARGEFFVGNTYRIMRLIFKLLRGLPRYNPGNAKDAFSATLALSDKRDSVDCVAGCWLFSYFFNEGLTDLSEHSRSIAVWTYSVHVKALGTSKNNLHLFCPILPQEDR